MEPEVSNSFNQIAFLPADVRALYAKHNVRIRPHADLNKMLTICTDVHKRVNAMDEKQLLEVCRAQRVLQAIVGCKDEGPELKEPLNRIASSLLEPTSKQHSAGKDAVFELEFLQYVKHRGFPAKLGEPDVVAQASFGEYFVACKSINSLENFDGQLRSGSSQVGKYGHGCVAFNLEPQSFLEQPLRVNRGSELKGLLDTQLRGFYSSNTRRFDQKLQEGRLDGVVLQMSCFADITESQNVLDVFTHSVFYSRSQLQGLEAQTRFDSFRRAMNGPLGESRRPRLGALKSLGDMEARVS